MAKIALISDIHGNLSAFQAILDKLDEINPDFWICLGDIVGYGPNPSECIDIIMERNIKSVMGNHDAGVAGLLSLRHFRNPNRKLIEISQDLITTDQKKWLKNLPYTLTDNHIWTAAHASPINPEKWMYIDSAIKARNVIEEVDTKLCFVGHTHIPSFVSDQIGVLNFTREHNYLINPGSIGQSRDNDFRSSCCVIDTESWEIRFIRTEYNTEKVLTGLSKLGFSRSESKRLMRY
ncbi:MAG: metallophosphoesterase family protein [Balneola sp.]